MNIAAQDGSAMRLVNASASLLRCNISDNEATASNEGGAILALNSSLDITDCNFTNNRASTGSGGAIHALGNVEGFGDRGSEVNTTVILKACHFLGNSARSAGGALSAEGTVVTVRIETCSFVGNNAIDDGGGAIYAAHGADLDISGSAFTNNTSQFTGGAIYALEAIVILKSCNLTHNSAVDGGAVHADGGAELAAADCNFTSNSATNNGGAIYAVPLDRTVSLDRCILEHNTALFGGAVLTKDFIRFNASDCQFRHNAAAKGGGALVALVFVDEEVESTVDLRRTVFESNAADAPSLPPRLPLAPPSLVDKLGSGGALLLGTHDLFRVAAKSKTPIIISKGRLAVNVQDSEFVENSSVLGGAIAAMRVAILSMASVSFSRNSARTGGAIYAESEGAVDPQMFARPKHYLVGVGARFEGNLANGSGGAVYLQVGRATAPLARGSLSPLKISSTADVLRNGEYETTKEVQNEDDVFFEDTHFLDNAALGSGGAVHAERGRVGCRHCVFEANSVQQPRGAGGAVCLVAGSAFHARNVSLKGNRADEGGGVYARDSAVDIVSSSVQGNAARQGGGVYISVLSSSVFYLDIFGRIERTAFEDNSAEIGGGLFMQKTPGGSGGPDTGPTFMALTLSNFTDNAARIAGGALFTNAPAALDLCCDCTLEVEEHLGTIEGLHPGFFDAEGVIVVSRTAHRVLDHPNWCNHTWLGNGDAEKGPYPVATTARSARVLAHGSKSRMDDRQMVRFANYSSGSDFPPFDVELVDALGQPAAGHPAAFPAALLRIISRSQDAIVAGQHITEAGVLTTLSELRLLSGTDERHKLTLYFEPDIGYNVSIVVDVRPCLPGEFPVDVGGAEQCQSCGEGLYSFDPTRRECLPCPLNADCTPSTVTPKDGFWHATSQSTVMRECIVPEACVFGNRTQGLQRLAARAHSDGMHLRAVTNASYDQCLSGYSGILCGACKDTHGRVKAGECWKCGSVARDITIIVLAAVWFIIISHLMVNSALATNNMEEAMLDRGGSTSSSTGLCSSQEGVARAAPPGALAKDFRSRGRDSEHYRRSYSTEVFKIFVNYLQTLGLAVAVRTGWTDAVYGFLGLAGLSSSTGDNLFSLECAFSSAGTIQRSVAKVAVSLAFPFMIMALFFFKCIVSWLRGGGSLPEGRLPGRLRISALSILYLFYVDITDNAARVFNCTSVGVGCEAEHSEEGCSEEVSKYWVEDTDVMCWTGQHLVLATAAALPMLLLVCLGFPLWLVYFTRSSGAALKERSVVETYGFLYRSFNDDSRYWEAVILLRRGLLAGVSVFSFCLGSGAQAFLSLAILFAAGIGHSWARPFETPSPRLNLMEMLSISSSFLVFFLGGLFSTPLVAGSETAQKVLSAVLIAQAFAVFLYLFVQLLIESMREVLHVAEGKGGRPGSKVLRWVAQIVLGMLLKGNETVLRLAKRMGGFFCCVPGGGWYREAEPSTRV
eukprot:evm.model.scf_390.2 EVM.evm.TU.scf_390.2   scf_390:46861-59712(+)